MKMKTVLLCTMLLGVTVYGESASVAGREAYNANPILPGYYADPSLVQFDGKYYLYATLDPWGGETLGCWESDDFKNWTYRKLNWPTKAACTSATSKGAMVWAPSVVQGTDGKFYMYVSVGNEVWAGTADHPLGPWKNLLGDQPLIPENYKPGYHMIDAEAFVDDDGQAYLYWGSGWNWVNGKCWAVKLKPDMKTFDGDVLDVTPGNYFEGPFMVKHGGRYHLMYSSGRTPLDTYQVHSAVADSPFGPFVEEENSPVLVTDKSNNVVSPGHHAVFTKDGQPYILYHRHSIPYSPDLTLRQTCVDKLLFDEQDNIQRVVPTHKGPELVKNRLNGRKPLAATATASGELSEWTGAECVLDNNYATRWSAAEDAPNSWIQLDLGARRSISSMELRSEYAWKPYFFVLEISDDGESWSVLVDFTNTPAQGSPIVIEEKSSARYLRLRFSENSEGGVPSFFEWNVF